MKTVMNHTKSNVLLWASHKMRWMTLTNSVPMFTPNTLGWCKYVSPLPGHVTFYICPLGQTTLLGQSQATIFWLKRSPSGQGKETGDSPSLHWRKRRQSVGSTVTWNAINTMNFDPLCRGYILESILHKWIVASSAHLAGITGDSFRDDKFWRLFGRAEQTRVYGRQDRETSLTAVSWIGEITCKRARACQSLVRTRIYAFVYHIKRDGRPTSEVVQIHAPYHAAGISIILDPLSLVLDGRRVVKSNPFVAFISVIGLSFIVPCLMKYKFKIQSPIS